MVENYAFFVFYQLLNSDSKELFKTNQQGNADSLHHIVDAEPEEHSKVNQRNKQNAYTIELDSETEEHDRAKSKVKRRGRWSTFDSSSDMEARQPKRIKNEVRQKVCTVFLSPWLEKSWGDYAIAISFCVYDVCMMCVPFWLASATFASNFCILQWMSTKLGSWVQHGNPHLWVRSNVTYQGQRSLEVKL